MFGALRSWFGIGRARTADLQSMVSEYGAVLAGGTGLVRDLEELPFPKDQLKIALRTAISMTPHGPMRDHLRNGYVMLADFQDLSACSRSGIDAATLMLKEGKELLSELSSLEK